MHRFSAVEIETVGRHQTLHRGGRGEAHQPETHLIPLVLQVALGRRVRADRLRGGLFKGRPFVHDLETAEAQAALLITPAVSEQKVFLTVVPATLLFRKGKATVHPLEEMKVTASCPRTGLVLLGTGEVGGDGLLAGFLDGFDGAGGGTPGGFNLLIRVDVEPSP